MRRLFKGVGVLLLGLGVLAFCFGNVSVAARHATPIDMNWIAAQRLVDHQPLYDRAASHAEAVRLLGPEMRKQDDCIFCGFAGPPVTALLHVPFLPLGHDEGVSGSGSSPSWAWSVRCCSPCACCRRGPGHRPPCSASARC
jgi:hypothetical protein